MTLDNYTAVYSAGETSEVVTDLLVTIVVALVGFGTLIGLVFLYGWARKRVKGLKFN